MRSFRLGLKASWLGKCTDKLLCSAAILCDTIPCAAIPCAAIPCDTMGMIPFMPARKLNRPTLLILKIFFRVILNPPLKGSGKIARAVSG